MIRHFIVTTFSGSIYECQFRDDAWWFRGNNVPNPNSVKLDEGRWWRTDMPSTPEIGKGLFVNAWRGFDFHDSERMPGGGKWTSVVVDINIIEAD